jgi:hypothetical protein
MSVDIGVTQQSLDMEERIYASYYLKVAIRIEAAGAWVNAGCVGIRSTRTKAHMVSGGTS